MPHRFFTNQSLATNDITFIDSEQVHQLTRVLRMGAGDRFVLCEGTGEDVEVEISHIHTVGRSSSMQLAVIERRPAWVPAVHFDLCLASIRKERFEWALEKCTELGVSHITPLTTDRAERGVVSQTRAQKILKEASEQCGRGNIPTYGEVVELENCISAAVQSGKIVIACVHSGVSFSEFLTQNLGSRLPGRAGSALGSISVLIGPEGGWSSAELALFKKHNVTEVSLGPTNLRAETAAVAACALIHTHVR